MGLLDTIFGSTKSATSQTSGTSSTQNQAFNDPRFQDFWNQFSNVFQGASGANTPINGYQTSAADQLAGAGQFVFPAYNNVNDVASNGITTTDINRYMSPYTQNVINATQDQFNNQNARTLAGNQATAAKMGALTGSQSQVSRALAEGQLAAAQSPVIAGLYQAGYNSAVDTAGKNAALRTQAAGTQGNLINSYTNAGNAAYNAGQGIWDSTYKNTMTPFQLMTQGANAWNPFLQGAGTTTQSSGTTTGTQTSTDSLWNIGKGLLATGMGIYGAGFYADGGSVKGDAKQFHEKVTDAFKAITEMKRSMGGGVMPRYDNGGFVSPAQNDPSMNYDPTWGDTTVEKEPAPWQKWAKDNQSIGYGPKDDGDMLGRQQLALSNFMSGLGRASGGMVRRGYEGGGFVPESDSNDPAIPNGSPMPNYPGFSYREPTVSNPSAAPVTTASIPAPSASRMPSRYAAPQMRDEMMYSRGNMDMPQGSFLSTLFGNTPKNGVIDGQPMSKWDRLTYLVGNASISTDGSGKAGITNALMSLDQNRRDELKARNDAAKLLMEQHSHPYDIAHKVAQTNLTNTNADKEFQLKLEKRKLEYAKQLAIAQKEAEMDLLLKNAERFGIPIQGVQPGSQSGGNTRLKFIPNPQPAPTSPSGYSEPRVPEPSVPLSTPTPPPPKKRNNESILGNSIETAHPSRAHAYVGQYYKRPDGTVWKKSLLGESADIKQ